MFKKVLARWACNEEQAGDAPAAPWIEGGIYVIPVESGGFQPLKILVVDADGVHIRLYSNHFPDVPPRIDESSLFMAGMERAADVPLGMGHMPVSRPSFATWRAQWIQASSVAVDELEGYEMWREAKGGYF